MHKETVKIAIVGHVDHGKSTLIGRLLLDTGSLSKDRIIELKKISKELGKDAELAFLVDQLKEEREQNKTIDTTQSFFKTRNKNFVIIDTPGHVELLKNMITGATQAESAILLIDAKEGVMEQTKRHIYVLDMIGINKIIILINKMDLVNYEKKRFDKVRAELLNFLKNLNIKPISILPVSAKESANISKRHPAMKWHKGPTLLKVMDSLKLKTKSKDKPLRFPVQDVYKMNGQNIVVGKVESGAIKKSKPLLLLPSNKEVRIKTIKIFGKYNASEVRAGQNTGLILDKDPAIKRGYMLVDRECPPKLINNFKGTILWLSKTPLKINSPMTLRCSTQEIECMIEKIHKRIDSSTLNTIEENAEELSLNETGMATFVTKTPVLVEKFSFIRELGRFSMEKDYEPIGIGIVI